MKPEYPTLAFKDSSAWRTWLDENHADSDGIWMRIFKKASDIMTVTYAEALDEALCYGWIDGQKKSFDELSFLQKFTPRRSRSMWSKRNIEHVERLTRAGLMMPAGKSEAEKAQQDGRWDAAYDGPSTMTIPDSFLSELKKHPVAQTRFDTLSKSARYSIGWQLQTARTQKTFEARQKKLIDDLKAV